jgi:hypothetical protein
MSAFAAVLSSIVLVEIVDAVIASLKVTVTAVVAATPVAPLAGLTDATVGGVVSAATVVNVEVNVVARALPAASLTRGSVVPPRTLTVNVLDPAKGEVGVSVATRLVAL